MPSSARAEYNPLVIGFVAGQGHVSIPLVKAREAYGQFPSEFGFLPSAASRRLRKTLNLSLGLAILRLLRAGHDLAETIARFYARWGRDFAADFQIRMEPFLRHNDPIALKRLLLENAATLGECQALDMREYLGAQGLISRSTLHSIPPHELLLKAQTILAKKMRNPAHQCEASRLKEALALTKARQGLAGLAGLTGGNLLTFGEERLAVHADQVAAALVAAAHHLPLTRTERLTVVRGTGVEFEFAPRDASFLDLGKVVGDCTADKAIRQVDREVENIYWTVFAWCLDRHYQVLKVHCDGEFVLKAHLLPLHLLTSEGGKVFLAVDAIETTAMLREDSSAGRPHLLERKESLFARVVEEIVRIAHAMGIEEVYAERFSNTGWVRRELEGFPEVYLRIGDVQKIDELEDVFELAKRICAAAETDAPASVFMELQMKNTYLQAGAATLKGIKSFAVLAGDPDLGVSLKRAFGV